MPGRGVHQVWRFAAGFLLLAAAFLVVMITTMTMTIGAARAQTNFDRPGENYTRFSLKSGDPAECGLRCERDRRCAAWSFSYPVVKGEGAMCALKSAVPPRVESTCCVSGIRGAGVVETKTGEFEMSIDRPGGDYRHFPLRPNGDAAACKAACDGDKKCRAWTYVRGGYISVYPRCYLKSKVRTPRRKPCCISGVVR